MTSHATAPASYVLPFVSVDDGDPSCRSAISVYVNSDHRCELADETCTESNVLFGDDDSHCPQFCFKHFHDLHAARRQSHVEPMNAEELAHYPA